MEFFRNVNIQTIEKEIIAQINTNSSPDNCADMIVP